MLSCTRRILERTRAVAFEALDAVQGAKVHQARRELEWFEQRDCDDPAAIRLERAKIRRLLTNATASVPRYAHLDGVADLSLFPVITKADLTGDQAGFRSAQHKRNLVVRRTSGSTGTPLSVVQDREKRQRVKAEVVHYSEKAGYRVGGLLVYMRAKTSLSGKPGWLQWLQNETILDIAYMNEKNSRELFAELSKPRFTDAYVLCYGSTLDSLVDFTQRNPEALDDLPIFAGVVSGSDQLLEKTREATASMFRCVCFNRYSNQENGILAQDEGTDDGFLVNTCHYKMEILELGSDRPVSQGEVGRIVVTDLHNFAMPMIRYDTGDLGALVIRVDRRGRRRLVLHELAGRAIDVVWDVQGSIVSNAVEVGFWEFPEIRQFQLIQWDTAKYELLVVGDDIPSVSPRLQHRMRQILGETAETTIRSVPKIDPLPSGKRSCVVNAMNKGS